VKNAPLEMDVLRRLSNRVGFMRRTTYGEEFSVRAQPGASNYAYLAAPLPLHTAENPGIQGLIRPKALAIVPPLDGHCCRLSCRVHSPARFRFSAL